MSRLANYYGAEILIAKSGRHTVLSNYIDSFLDKNKGGFKINYGMNLKTNIIDYFDLLALQVQNIPEGIENIIIPCGSSISSIGILYGLFKYKIEIPNIYLIGVAPNRKDMISRYLSILCPFFNYKFNYVDLFNTKGFFYTKDKKITYEDYTFHPNYEAKAFDWLLNNIDYMNHKTLFWIIGRKPSKSI